MAQGKAFTPEQKEEILESLKSYLEIGFSRSKACKMVGLHESTLSKWATTDEVLSMKLQGWENALSKLALSNIRDGLMKEAEMDDNRKESSWKYITVKEPEFNPKSEVKQTIDANVSVSNKEEIEKALDAII